MAAKSSVEERRHSYTFSMPSLLRERLTLYRKQHDDRYTSDSAALCALLETRLREVTLRGQSRKPITKAITKDGLLFDNSPVTRTGEGGR